MQNRSLRVYILYKGVLFPWLTRKNPKSNSFLSFACPAGRIIKTIVPVCGSDESLTLFRRRAAASLPAFISGSNEGEMVFDEHLFHHLESWIFVEQFDQRPRASTEPSENIV